MQGRPNLGRILISGVFALCGSRRLEKELISKSCERHGPARYAQAKTVVYQYVLWWLKTYRRLHMLSYPAIISSRRKLNLL